MFTSLVCILSHHLANLGNKLDLDDKYVYDPKFFWHNDRQCTAKYDNVMVDSFHWTKACPSLHQPMRSVLVVNIQFIDTTDYWCENDMISL